MKLSLSAGIAFATLLVAACSSSGTMSPSTAPSPLTQCTSVAPPVLAYPSPGSTSAPSGLLQLWFFYAQNPSASFEAPVLSGGGSSLTGTPFASPSPGPPPPGLPSTPSGDQIFVSNVSGVAAMTTYTVTVTNVTCGPDTLGSFTTR